MRAPYCTGALTPSGNSAPVTVPQARHWQACAPCSVSTSGFGSGRSNTWRAAKPVLSSRAGGSPQPEHVCGWWSSILSGLADCRSVSPLWPFRPPNLLLERSRRLRARVGFFKPSLDGGLELLALFKPGRRSSSAIRAFSAAFSASGASIRAACAATSASRSSVVGSGGASRIIRFLKSRNPAAVEKIAQLAPRTLFNGRGQSRYSQAKMAPDIGSRARRSSLLRSHRQRLLLSSNILKKSFVGRSADVDGAMRELYPLFR